MLGVLGEELISKERVATALFSATPRARKGFKIELGVDGRRVRSRSVGTKCW